MKYLYLAATIEENGKYYSHIARISEADNLFHRLNNIHGIIQAKFCTTRKQAAATVERWNAAHRANGKYLFDNPQF